MHTHPLRPGHEPPGTGRHRRLARRLVLLAAVASLAAPAGAQAQSCPTSFGAIDNVRSNKLYLYFPVSDADWFPNFDTQVRPAKAFDVSLLTAYQGVGTADNLRNAIHAVVVDAYCEFNVQVLKTTTQPPTVARRATVAIGTDSKPLTFGQAEAVDVGNAKAVDYARVWAGWYQARAGIKEGGALHGNNSTLERWAASIGGTAAHEAGHLYGLSHLNGSVVKPGEDALTRHLMPKGSLLTDEHRAGYRRHFNDTEFSILAANVGLAVQAMHNWGLVNPNDKPASRLRIDFLSPRSPVILSGSYTGSRSPWTNPKVNIGTLVSTGTFKGYRRFQITWSTPKTWDGAVPGQVPPGGQFFVGASFAGVDFNAPDPIIITDITLLDAFGVPLQLAPRLPGYDAGTLDAADGSFDVGFFNLGTGADALVLTDVQVFQLPRVLSLDAMLPGEPMRSWTGEPVLPWPARDSARPLGGSPRFPEPRGRYASGDVLRNPVRLLGGAPRFPEPRGRYASGNVLRDPVRLLGGAPRFPEPRGRFALGEPLRDPVRLLGRSPRFPEPRGRFAFGDTLPDSVLPDSVMPLDEWPQIPEPWGGFDGTFWDPVRPPDGWPRIPEPQGKFPFGGALRVPVARLAQGRHIFENVVTENCSAPADRSSDSEVNECVNGIFVDLFPATTVYVMATVVDPHARHWDPAQERFVVGPVESHIFYQFAGQHPDLNRNGTDDAIDIFRGTSKDANRDGVPDDARRVPRGLLLVLLAIGAVVGWKHLRHE